MALDEKSKFVSELGDRVEALDAKERVKLKKNNLRVFIAYGLLVLLMLIPIAIATNKVTALLNSFGVIIWILLVILLQVQLNHKDFTIAMITGVNRIADELRIKALEDMEEEIKHGDTNAKRNRKK